MVKMVNLLTVFMKIQPVKTESTVRKMKKILLQPQLMLGAQLQHNPIRNRIQLMIQKTKRLGAQVTNMSREVSF